MRIYALNLVDFRYLKVLPLILPRILPQSLDPVVEVLADPSLSVFLLALLGEELVVAVVLASPVLQVRLLSLLLRHRPLLLVMIPSQALV